VDVGDVDRHPTVAGPKAWRLEAWNTVGLEIS
jgi:hypothetical protein